MTNGTVFFINNSPHGWWIADARVVPTGIRGYVRDGCWWMDYNIEKKVVNVCPAQFKIRTVEEETPDWGSSVSWNEPMNVMKVKVLHQIPVTINSDDYNTVMQWAKEQHVD